MSHNKSQIGMHVNFKVNPGLEKKLIVTIILVRFFNCFVWFTFVLFVFRPIFCCTVHVLYWIFFTLPLLYPPTKRLPLESTHKPDTLFVRK